MPFDACEDIALDRLEALADRLFPSRQKDNLLGGKGILSTSVEPCGKLVVKYKKTNGKSYPKYFFYCSEEKIYIPSKRVEKVQAAIEGKKTDAEIIELIKSVELLEDKNARPHSKKRREKGEGTGCIFKKPIQRGNKTYDQWWFGYEISGQRHSKYIHKRKVEQVQKMNGEKIAIAKILKVIGAKK